MTILPDQERFSGRTSIDVTFAAPRNALFLHGKDLNVARAEYGLARELMDEHGLSLLQSVDGDGTIGAGGVLGRYQPDFYNHIWRGDIDAARACGQKDIQILQRWYTPELIGRYGSSPSVLKVAFKMRGVPVADGYHDMAIREGEVIGFLMASPSPAREGWLIEQLVAS